MRLRRSYIYVLTALGVAAAGLVLAMSSGATSSASTIRTGVASILKRNFTVFRVRTGDAAVAEPANVTRMISGLTTGPGTMTFVAGSTSVTPVTASGGIQVWVVGGSGGACMITTAARDGSDVGQIGEPRVLAACQPTSGVLAGTLGLLMTPRNGRGETMVGLVPDDNSTVSVTTTGGPQGAVSVRHNVFAVETAGRIMSVRVLTAKHHVKISRWRWPS